MKKEYTKHGKCIWCSKEKPEVTFFEKPHTISKKLGAKKIGFDICDSCNKYFGTREKSSKYQMSVELAFKEIFNVTRYLLPEFAPKNNKQYLRSVYFDLFKTERIFRIKKTFKFKPDFIKNFTRQFKRGIYEVFLQEYHRNTGLGLNDKFNIVRKFVRYDYGDLPLYFGDNNGVYLVPEKPQAPSFYFSDKVLSNINDFGFYTMFLFGHLFYLEVTPKAAISRDIYLRKEASKLIGSGFIYNSLKEMKYVTDLDFSLNKLGKSETN
ncbi:MAG: hypothetical protein IMY72_07080 [Bacteroidetes bacterium]|nr:hypothetical protein [Bacteroidota bacterium]